MCIHTGVASCTCKILIFPIGNMYMSSGVPEPLGQSEIDKVDYVAAFAQTH